MADLKLKENIFEIVDNQIRDNNPPCTKEIFDDLLDAGYSESEAKDKIGAVVLSEIYDLLKDEKGFDEEHYKQCLQKMLQKCLDYEDDFHIETEWDEWDSLVQDGYDDFDAQNTESGFMHWNQAWMIFQSIIEQLPEKMSEYQLMDELDYDYAFDGWLQDYEMELGNAGKQEERIAFCQKVLELFDWDDDLNESCFKSGIGDALFYTGKKEEAFQFYENWLREDSQNANGINAFSFILEESGEPERAYETIRRITWGIPCHEDNSFLFMRAKQLAEKVGKHTESAWYQEQLDKFQKALHDYQMNEDPIFDEFTAPKQIPVVKPAKIYPNDPCPCGSGKKYKKCCGKN